MAEARPSHLPPGTPIGAHYKVEGLVRLAERRMFYFVNDNREDLPNRKCWDCGHPSTPRASKSCASCGAPLRDRRFLMSCRWDTERFEPYLAFAAKELRHPGLCPPLDVFRVEDQLFSIVAYNGEGLMIDESAPLANLRVLDVGQRIAGTLAFLQLNGVQLTRLTRANLFISPDNAVRLFDIEVERVFDGPVPPEHRGAELASIGDLLRRYCDVEAEALAQFLRSVEDGVYKSPADFGRAVEQRFDAFGNVTYPTLLGGTTDVGLVRPLNEDNWGWRKLSARARMYVVADGMGGHDAGEVASDIAVKTWCKVAREREAVGNLSLDELEKMVGESFQAANNAIKDEAESKGTDMGTTLVGALVVDNKHGFVANVGDSRAYLWRAQTLHQVSKDHSLVAKMVERGRISEDQARNHPHSNILLRTVGTERDVEVDVFRVDLQSGDRLIMCSDGLWGEVEDRDIENILNSYADPRLASRELIRAAHQGGGKDNVTVVIVTMP